MRIMLVHAPAPITRELHQRGHEVLVCNATQRSMVDTARGEHELSSAPVINFAGNRKLSWNAIRNVAAQVRRYRPDILHAFTPASLAWSVLGTSGIRRRPSLISFRGIPRLLRHSDPSEWISYLSPRVRMHACESHAVMQSMLRSGIARDRLRVTYNTAWDFDLTKSAEAWRAEWNVSSGEIVIGTVAHVRPIKGIDLLVRALLEMTDVPNWKLIIVGKIDDRLVTALSESPAIQGRVLFTGHLEHAPSAMQAFDLFVMPSRSEGLCRALIEAMTLGVCPIVSSAGGMKELVRNEQDGLVFPIDDTASLSFALRRLIGDHEQRQNFGRSACEHVQTLCTPQVVVDQLENLYSYVMQRDWDDEFD